MEGAMQDWWLKHRWGQLNQWLKDGSLPHPDAFLNISHRDFLKLDPNRAYPVSWSLFQFLMSTPEKRLILNQMLDRYQTQPGSCAKSLDSLYPGGLAQFETDWHEWIRLPFKTPFAPPPTRNEPEGFSNR
jgi:hypothetical protein